MEDLKLITNRLTKQIGTIPNFIDTKMEEHYRVYILIQDVLRVYKLCLKDYIIDRINLSDLTVMYYGGIVTIFNDADRSLYTSSIAYIDAIYDRLLEQLQLEECWEAAANLYHMVNIGTQIDEEENESESE